MEEVLASLETQTGEVERQPKLAQDERRAAGGVGDEVGLGAKSADDDTHDDGAAGYAEAHGGCGTGDGDGDRAKQQTEHHAEEDAAEDKLLHIVERLGSTDDNDTVAILQAQVVGGKELQVAAQDTAHVDTIGGTQLEVYQMLSIEHLARYDDGAARHF